MCQARGSLPSLVPCEVNSRPLACKFRLTCEAATAFYGEHRISVQYKLANHSRVAGGERVCVCACVCVSEGKRVSERERVALSVCRSVCARVLVFACVCHKVGVTRR